MQSALGLRRPPREQEMRRGRGSEVDDKSAAHAADCRGHSCRMKRDDSPANMLSWRVEGGVERSSQELKLIALIILGLPPAPPARGSTWPRSSFPDSPSRPRVQAHSSHQGPAPSRAAARSTPLSSDRSRAREGCVQFLLDRTHDVELTSRSRCPQVLSVKGKEETQAIPEPNATVRPFLVLSLLRSLPQADHPHLRRSSAPSPASLARRRPSRSSPSTAARADPTLRASSAPRTCAKRPRTRSR